MRTVPSIILLIMLGSGLQSVTAQSGSVNQTPQVAFSSEAPAWQQPFPANYHPASPIVYSSSLGSTYVPMDNWVYPALDRLHSMGYLDTAFLGLRPWTRLSIAHMLQETADKIDNNPNDDEARELYLALVDEFANDQAAPYSQRTVHAEFESTYSILRGIIGTPLNDSYHLGQTIVNDYGRPYQEGFNNYTGFSARAEQVAFRFTSAENTSTRPVQPAIPCRWPCISHRPLITSRSRPIRFRTQFLWDRSMRQIISARLRRASLVLLGHEI